MTKLTDGIIHPNSDRARVLGFTSRKFEGYLWKMDGSIIISFIISKKRGNFRELVRRIHELGFTVKIPTPLGRMQEIVLKNGYELTREPFAPEIGEFEMVDVWVLKPTETSLVAHTPPSSPPPS